MKLDKRHYDCLGSTNGTLAELAVEGAAEGTVVWADAQTAGRGRLDRAWHSPPGRNLYFSLLLRPKVAPPLVSTLALVAGLSVRDALQARLLDRDAKVKWPNDVWVDQRKICGVLCETAIDGGRVSHVVVGVGVNVNMDLDCFPSELRSTATSLKMETGREHQRERLLDDILARFDRDYADWLARGDLTPFLDRWRAASVLLGRVVNVKQGGEILNGVVDELAPEGELIMKRDDGMIVAIRAGDVSPVRIHGENKRRMNSLRSRSVFSRYFRL